MKEMPLVTFALFAFNQENYIEEAVEGAFSQTYSPLEIILSDDCSTDRTFEILEEKVLSYTGPHKVRLNRNVPNVGLIAHVTKVQEMATGAFIVTAAGDDISMPDRVAELVEVWLSRKVAAV
ncbi:MAG: glycosyltransferase [Sphingobacteriales bacterium]|nr:MAG: glycosyltransferase [Sphingobacteriales bacterium]